MLINDGVIVEVMGRKYRFENYEDLEWTLKDFRAEWGTYLEDAPSRSRKIMASLEDILDTRELDDD